MVQKITASDSSQNSFYGREVAIGNGTIAIGADGESAAGSVLFPFVYSKVELCRWVFV